MSTIHQYEAKRRKVTEREIRHWDFDKEPTSNKFPCYECGISFNSLRSRNVHHHYAHSKQTDVTLSTVCPMGGFCQTRICNDSVEYLERHLYFDHLDFDDQLRIDSVERLLTHFKVVHGLNDWTYGWGSRSTSVNHNDFAKDNDSVEALDGDEGDWRNQAEGLDWIASSGFIVPALQPLHRRAPDASYFSKRNLRFQDAVSQLHDCNENEISQIAIALFHVQHPTVSPNAINTLIALVGGDSKFKRQYFTAFDATVPAPHAPKVVQKSIKQVKKLLNQDKSEDHWTRSVLVDVEYLLELPDSPTLPPKWNTSIRDPVQLAINSLLASKVPFDELLLHAKPYFEGSDKNRVYSELNTGDAWIECQETVRSLSEKGMQNAIILPLILESDGTSISQSNNVESWPVRVVCGNLPLSERRKHTNKMLVCNVEIPGTVTKGTVVINAQVFHRLMEEISRCIASYQQQGGVRVTLQENDVLLFPVLLLVVTDNKDMDMYCLHKQNFTIKAKCRRCTADKSISSLTGSYSTDIEQVKRRDWETVEKSKQQNAKHAAEVYKEFCSGLNTYPVKSGFAFSRVVDGNQMGWYRSSAASQLGVAAVCGVDSLHSFFSGALKLFLQWISKELIAFTTKAFGNGTVRFNAVCSMLSLRPGVLPSGGNVEAKDFRTYLKALGLAIKLSGVAHVYITRTDIYPTETRLRNFKIIEDIIVSLCDVEQIVSAPKVRESDLHEFVQSLKDLDRLFESLFPDGKHREKNINKKLKFHEFGFHSPECIRAFGSLLNCAADSLEGSHKYHRKLIQSTNLHSDLDSRGTRKNGKIAQTTAKEYFREDVFELMTRMKQLNVLQAPTQPTSRRTLCVTIAIKDLQNQISLFDSWVCFRRCNGIDKTESELRNRWENCLSVLATKELIMEKLIQYCKNAFDTDLGDTMKIGIVSDESPAQHLLAFGDKGTSKFDRVSQPNNLAATRICAIKYKDQNKPIQYARLFCSVLFNGAGTRELVVAMYLEKVSLDSGFSPYPFVLHKFKTTRLGKPAFKIIILDKVAEFRKVSAFYSAEVDVHTGIKFGSRKATEVYILPIEFGNLTYRPT